MDKIKVVVIGSNSFSGSDFVDLLLEKGKYSVVGISRSQEKDSLFLPYKRHLNHPFKFYQMDLNKDMDKIIDVINEFKPDYIINFSAQSEVAPSWENPTHWFQTNVVAITNLANRLKDFKFIKRYVHISTPEVYGSCSGLVKENMLLNPSTPYAASKAAGDLSLFTFLKNFNFPLVVIRSANVYGAYQQLHKIIPRSIIYIKLGKMIELHGGGNARRSFIHIRDISKGELFAMEKGRIGEIYHLSPNYLPTDFGIAIRDLVRKICEKMDVLFEKVTKGVEDRPGQDALYALDSSKARQEFGWKPNITLDEGLDDVINWIEKNWDKIKNQPLGYIHKP
ncbi:TPA: dTDP-glucose 4,6-dehydratase [bacterium]|nr:dTDP-glucose 4,6-dehydratase [bacterium]